MELLTQREKLYAIRVINHESKIKALSISFEEKYPLLTEDISKEEFLAWCTLNHFDPSAYYSDSASVLRNADRVYEPREKMWNLHPEWRGETLAEVSKPENMDRNIVRLYHFDKQLNDAQRYYYKIVETIGKAFSDIYEISAAKDVIVKTRYTREKYVYRDVHYRNTRTLAINQEKQYAVVEITNLLDGLMKCVHDLDHSYIAPAEDKMKWALEHELFSIDEEAVVRQAMRGPILLSAGFRMYMGSIPCFFFNRLHFPITMDMYSSLVALSAQEIS